jgi:outer membrane receptor protein involved in Fe transport
MSSGRLWLAVAGLFAAAGPALAQAQADQAAPPAKPAAPPAKPAPAAKAPAKPPAGKTVETLTVTGGRPDVDTSQIDRKSYSMGKDLQAQTGSIADALRNLPSVDVDVQGNLSLRGDPNVTILVDGKPAPQFEGKGRADALQQLPADQIDRVEVITTPSAALNPEGSGGVINLITKKSRGAGPTGSVYLTVGSSSLRRVGAAFGYNSPKLNVTGSISGAYQINKQEGREVRSALDPVSGQFLDHLQTFVGRGFLRSPSGRLNLTYTPDAKDQLTAAFNSTELLSYGHPFNHFADEDMNGGTVDYLNRQGHRRFEEMDTGYTADWKHTFGEGHSLTIDLLRNQSRPRDRVTWTTAQASPPPVFTVETTYDFGTQVHDEARLVYTQHLFGGALVAGYEWKHDDQHYDYHDFRGFSETAVAEVDALANVFTFRQTINTGYATWERTFGDVGVQGGLRVEHVRWDIDQLTSGQQVSQDYVRAYPSLHVSWKLDDDRKINASLSQRIFRPPAQILNPRLYVTDPRNIQQGNPDLQPAGTHSYELGYEQHSAGSTYIATLFYRDNEGEFTTAIIPLPNGVFATTYLNEGSSKAVGLELTASGRLTPTITYNAGLTPYWASVDSGNPQFGGERSVVTVQGRGSVNWQATGDDLLQLQANGRGKVISAQGFFEPVWTLNFGWRHKLSDRASLTLTGQDILATNHFTRNLMTPVLLDHFVVEPVSQSVLLRFDYRFGGGAARPQQDFQYENGGGGPTPGPGR